MMFWAEGLLIAVFLVLIGVNAYVIGARRRTNRDRTDDHEDIERLIAAVEAAQEENESLRQRLEVLERLATDEDVRLARDIDRLKRKGEGDSPSA